MSVERDLPQRRCGTWEPVGHQPVSSRCEQCYFLAGSNRQNMTQQIVFVAASSLLSLWCVGAFRLELKEFS